MSIELIIQNTNSTSLQLNSIAGDLYANSAGSSIRIGNVSAFTPVVFRGNTQGVIIVDVRLFALSIVNDVIRAFQNNNFSQELELDASANVSGIQVPVNMSFKVGL